MTEQLQNTRLFEQYPPVKARVDWFTDDQTLLDHPPRPMGRAEAFIRNGDYVRLPRNSTEESQRDNLDAAIGRRVQRVGRGVLAATVGAMLTANADQMPAEIETQVGTAGLVLFGLGIFRAYMAYEKDPRIDTVREIHRYESKIRMPGSFLTLTVSKRLYERYRKWQYRNYPEKET